MKLLKGGGDFFAVDIGTKSIRIVQLGGDAKKGFHLRGFSYADVGEEVIIDDSEAGKRRLGETIASAVKQAGITTKDVVIGLSSRKTFTTVIEMPNRPVQELENILKYEIEKYVPMAIDTARVDHVVLGPDPLDSTKANILIAAVDATYAEDRMDLLENVGFNVIAEEPDLLAIARSLTPYGSTDSRVIVDFGSNSTDIVVVNAGTLKLVRSVNFGMRQMSIAIATAISVNEEQANQMVTKFGLDVNQVEGKIARPLAAEIDELIAELKRSVDFYKSKNEKATIGAISLSGFVSQIPLASNYIEERMGISVINSDPFGRVSVSPQQKQALAGIESEFAVAVGLAERSNTRV